MAPLSMTLSDFGPGFQGHGIFRRLVSLKASRGLSAIAKFLYLCISDASHPISVTFCMQRWISISLREW